MNDYSWRLAILLLINFSFPPSPYPYPPYVLFVIHLPYPVSSLFPSQSFTYPHIGTSSLSIWTSFCEHTSSSADGRGNPRWLKIQNWSWKKFTRRRSHTRLELVINLPIPCEPVNDTFKNDCIRKSNARLRECAVEQSCGDGRAATSTETSYKTGRRQFVITLCYCHI